MHIDPKLDISLANLSANVTSITLGSPLCLFFLSCFNRYFFHFRLFFFSSNHFSHKKRWVESTVHHSLIALYVPLVEESLL